MELEKEIKALDVLIAEMAGQVEENLFYALSVYTDYDSTKVYPEVNDGIVNAYERIIEEKALNIMLKERLFASDLRKVTGIMDLVQDLERLGDHAQDVLEFALRLKNQSVRNERILALADFVIGMVKDGIDSYIAKDEKKALEVMKRDDHVDQEYAAIIEELTSKESEKLYTRDFAIYTALVVKYLERIADHATNVAEWVVYILTGYYKDRQII